jgi:putative PEP-CTERM system TPR-repeat lipoprotein
MKNKLAITISIIVALNISACSEDKTLEQYLSTAEAFNQNHDFSSAIIELKNAVRLAPKSTDARFYLGKAYLQQGNYLNAEKELERAQKLGFEFNKIITLLIQAKSKLYKTEEVYDLIQQGNQLNDDDYVLLLTYGGITALQEKDKEHAEDYFQQAISLSESAQYSGVAKAYLSRANNNIEQGLTIIDQVLLEQADFSAAILLKAHLLFANKLYLQSSEYFGRYIKQHPQENSVRFFEIDSLIRAEKYKEAESRVDKLLAKFEMSPLANQFKAQLEYQKENFTQAKKYAELASQQGNGFLFAKLIAGISSYQLGEIEQAYGYLQPIEKYLPASHPAKKTLAVIKIKLGYNAEAAETLISLENLSAEDTKLLQASSYELMKAGDFESAKELLDKAVDVSPDNASVVAQRGFFLLSQNDLSGIKSLEKSLMLDPTLVDVELSLALQYLANGEEKKAKLIANKWTSTADNKVSGLLLLGIINTKQQLNEQAKENFTQVLNIEPNNVAALYNLGLLAEFNNNNEQAATLYHKVILADPSHEEALARLIKLESIAGNLADNIDFLTELMQKNPRNVNLAIGLAQNLRLDKQIMSAIQVLERVGNEKNLPVAYWVILSDSYLENKQFEKLNKTVEIASRKHPNNLMLHLRKISMLEIMKKYHDSLQAAKDAYKGFPNNTRLEMQLAYLELLLLNKNGYIFYRDKLAAKKIQHHFLDRLAGQYAMMEKAYPQAIEHFSSAYEQNNSVDNALELARALVFDKRKLEATKVLESYLTENENEQVTLLLASLYTPEQSLKKKALYIKILEKTPDSPIVLNNLAWQEYEEGRITEALKYIIQANKIKPNYLPVLESYGVILVAADNLNKGIDVLELAMSKASVDSNVKLSLAQAYIEKSRFREAKRLLDDLESKDNQINKRIAALRSKIK